MNVFEHLLPIDFTFRFNWARYNSYSDTFLFPFTISICLLPEVPKNQHAPTQQYKKENSRFTDFGERSLFTSALTEIFTETIDAAPAYQRNTVRVKDCLRELAFRSNCIQAAKLSKKLSLPVSHDTLLRLIYETPMPTQTSPFPRY